MRPENAPGTPADTRSLGDVAGYNAATRAWEAFPPLPVPRSSHDVAVVGDEVFVIGGWNMRGADPAVWADTMAVLDVRAAPMRWESVAQPFQRRAFVTAVRGNLIYVIGGMDPEGKVLDDVDVYDVASGAWSKGPALPKGARNGFSPAACTLDNRVYVSLGDGGFYRLDDVAGTWQRIATTTARVAHRLVAGPGQRLLLLGGASRDGMLDLIESIDVSPAAIARADRLPPPK
jgi:N-acetylneuraminic acid mutarotase